MVFPLDASGLIPQKEPIVLVNRLLYSDEKKSVSDFEIREDCIFVEDGRLVLAGVMENIAQTCALRTGYKSLSGAKGDGKVHIGVIGGIKELTVTRFPVVGERLTTTVTEILNLGPAMVVTAEVRVGDETVASCNMKVFTDEKEA